MCLSLFREIVRSIRPFIGNKKKWSYQCRLTQLRPVLTRISAAINISGATEPRIRHPRPGPPQTSRRSFLPSRFVYRDNFLLPEVFLISIYKMYRCCNFFFWSSKYSNPPLRLKSLMRDIFPKYNLFFIYGFSLINLYKVNFFPFLTQ